MFAIIYGLFNVIGLTISGAIAGKDNYDCMKRAEERKRNNENPHNIYYDRKGAMRDLTTHKNVSIDYIGCESEGKDQYMRDMYGHPIKNLSEERRQQNLVNAKKDARRTVCEWKSIPLDKHLVEGYPAYEGKVYKDLHTGAEYVCRCFPYPKEITEQHGYCKCYMNIENGLLVREADSQKYDRQRGLYNFSEETVYAFIQFFNKKQQAEGYYLDSNIPEVSGWEQKESKHAYRTRMGRFYCNKFVSTDMPR